ncbi:hypothetical protein [Chelatococcus asaccharovorans]|uniref:hypothetical protein n=1 Tax=Chelatococcus asaccharovorans TaxID=28210 RepID=UPI00224C6C81|nr:hypothetical protein [Chelatococcus asaccharovorans]CAH1653166.1 conserved membrane hypothetical protein [Chelatococcus asaccharovorans]CAH1693956.1 conserved membrane hypothetical protein [Chelatococcus asaccharovorans]
MRRLEARSLRDRLAAMVIAIAVAMAIAAGGWRVLDAAWAESAPGLDGATRLGAEAVGRALSGQIEHALALGIPLDKLVRVEDYLKSVVASAPQVDAVALLDEAGRPIFTTREGVAGLTFPVNGGGQRATLVLSTESPFLNAATVRLEILLGATALLGGMIAFLIASLFLEMHLAPARARLALALARAARGDFAVAIPTTGRGRTTAAFRALARRIEPVHVAARHLADGIATVRAIDFDGSLSKRLDPLLATVAATRGLADIDPGETPRSTVPSPAAIATRVLLLVSLYAGAWPLLANFAIDRGTDMIPAPWRPVTPLFAEAVAVVLGMLICRSIAPSASRVAAALGTALTALAFTAVFWCRSYDLFVALRAAAGLGLGVALTPLLRDPRLTAHPRGLVALIGLTGLVIGPLFGGLVAEAIGRRGTFALLGIALLAIAPRAAAMPAAAAGDTALRLNFPAQAGRLLQLLSLMTLAALVLVIVPSGPGFDNYAVGAGLIVAAGLGLVVAPATLPPVFAGLLVGVAGALWLSAAGAVLPEAWRWPVSSMLIGIGVGSLLKWQAAGLFRHGRSAIAGLALGAVVAPVATIPGFAAMSIMLPLGVLLAGVSMLARGRRNP